MVHKCPECGSENINAEESDGLVIFHCLDCDFSWGDYKNWENKESKPKLISDEPPKPDEPEL